MFESSIQVLIWFAAISAGLMAGIYFAFSGFIMKSFAQLDADKSVAAMNAINEVILRSWFMPLFFGSSLAYLLLCIHAIMDWNNPIALPLLMAGLTYLVCMFFCTAFFNVPLNNLLATAEESSADKTSLWLHYLKNWTRWNHLRVVGSLISCLICLWVIQTL